MKQPTKGQLRKTIALMERTLDAAVEATREAQAQLAETEQKLRKEESDHSNTLEQRDRAENAADELAKAISEYFRVDIGEHSSAALTELSTEHDRKQALLLEAHCERVSILQEPIRQLEAPDRFGGGVMTRRQANKLRRLIRAHTAAQVELSWAGAGDPTERGELEDEAKAAMTALEKFISELEVV